MSYKVVGGYGRNEVDNSLDDIRRELMGLSLDVKKLDQPFISHLINVAVTAIDDECLLMLQ